MIVTGERGGIVGENFLSKRVRHYLSKRPSVIGSDDPVEILGGILAAFSGGFRVALEDEPAESHEGSENVRLPASDATGSQSEDLEEIRNALLQEGSKGEVVLYTSGTTGKPAAVSHGWKSLFRGARIGPKHRGAVWALCYNPSHVAGLQVLLQAFLNDCDIVDLFHADPVDRSGLLRESGVTHLSATPSWLRILISDLAGEPPFESVKSVTLGGERFDARLAEAAKESFPNAQFRNIYASTEVGTLLVSDGDIFTVPDFLEDAVRIEDGCLLVSPAMLADSWEGIDAWYDSGDRVEVLSENPVRFRFVGRDSDNVSVGGYNVNLAEVESCLRGHSGVREARVSARPNSVLGQILTAEVVPEGPALEEKDLRKYLGKHFPSHAVPRIIRSVEGLSLSRTGKLER